MRAWLPLVVVALAAAVGLWLLKKGVGLRS
mgnify:CR=1 FL=1